MTGDRPKAAKRVLSGFLAAPSAFSFCSCVSSKVLSLLNAAMFILFGWPCIAASHDTYSIRGCSSANARILNWYHIYRDAAETGVCFVVRIDQEIDKDIVSHLSNKTNYTEAPRVATKDRERVKQREYRRTQADREGTDPSTRKVISTKHNRPTVQGTHREH